MSALENVVKPSNWHQDLEEPRRLLGSHNWIWLSSGIPPFSEAAADLAQLRAENAEMTKALKPFAEEGEKSNDFPLPDSKMISMVKYTDCKRATTVLAKYQEVKK